MAEVELQSLLQCVEVAEAGPDTIAVCNSNYPEAGAPSTSPAPRCRLDQGAADEFDDLL
jgi:hypothetical protein